MVTNESIIKKRQQDDISDIIFQREFSLDTHEARQTYKNRTDEVERLRETNREASRIISLYEKAELIQQRDIYNIIFENELGTDTYNANTYINGTDEQKNALVEVDNKAEMVIAYICKRE